MEGYIGWSQLYTWSVDRPIPHLHVLYLAGIPGRSQLYKDALVSRYHIYMHQEKYGRPATHLQVLLFFYAHSSQSNVTIGGLVGLLYIRNHGILGQPQPVPALQWEYWSACAMVTFISWSRFYNMRVGRPAPRLHSFYIMGDPRPLKDVQLEY